MQRDLGTSKCLRIDSCLKRVLFHPGALHLDKVVVLELRVRLQGFDNEEQGWGGVFGRQGVAGNGGSGDGAEAGDSP